MLIFTIKLHFCELNSIKKSTKKQTLVAEGVMEIV